MTNPSSWRWTIISVGLLSCCASAARGESEDVLLNLQDPAFTAPIMTVAPPTEPRLTLGLNYLGGQVRWSLWSKWAAEGQYQTGKASSDFGDVGSKVYGLRVYHFAKKRGRMIFYLGPELAYTTAESDASNYKTRGFILGAFGGFDYYLARRISLGMDIGPYLISLKEKQTGLTQTTLDFVLNTTLNWHLL